MNIDIRDVTIFAMFCVVVWALTRCADNGNRAAEMPLPSEDAETPALHAIPGGRQPQSKLA